MTMEEKHFAFAILAEDARGNRFDSPTITELQNGDQVAKLALQSYYGQRWIGGFDTVLDDRSEITVIIDYPLSRPCSLHISGSGPVTVGRFCKAVSDMYHVIYKEEERTSTIAESNIPGMLNRAATDGKYGVWGHGIGDLFLEGAGRRADGTWFLYMGS